MSGQFLGQGFGVAVVCDGQGARCVDMDIRGNVWHGRERNASTTCIGPAVAAIESRIKSAPTAQQSWDVHGGTKNSNLLRIKGKSLVRYINDSWQ